MSEAETVDSTQLSFNRHLIGLMSQQLWCWGRDIVRPDGNWLLQSGFDRTAPPTDRENCSSVYTLSLAPNRTIVLRGFGVFYGNSKWGGVFWPRFESHPLFTSKSKLDRLPWSDCELPELVFPAEDQRVKTRALTLELIAWIHQYETNIIDKLGIEYRESTLETWNDGRRSVTPADKIAAAWQALSQNLPDNFWHQETRATAS